MNALISIILFIIGARLGWLWCKRFYRVEEIAQVLNILMRGTKGEINEEQVKEEFKNLAEKHAKAMGKKE